jgi:hypothetical protein
MNADQMEILLLEQYYLSLLELWDNMLHQVKVKYDH